MRSIDPRLWNAAVELFASKGFVATGIRDIADRAGLSVSALYYYVSNKEELLLQIMRDTQEQLVAACRSVAERLSAPEEQLAGLTQLHVIGQARYRLEASVVDTEIRALGAEGRQQMIQLRDQIEARWTDALERGRTQGVFTFINARTTRLALVEMCNGVAHWYSPDGQMDPEQLAQEFADLALAMVRATRDGAPLTLNDLDLPASSWFASLLHGVGAPVQASD
ncbi:MAG: TetR/AcrR family transcriptional regulator [Actinobacteria bacterium]|nr:TetR/AcrR family transcriptional regulator [Actinomycetota bacterium]